MALAHSPSIPRRNLALYIDAKNPKSYPGSRTTWFDISGNNLNWTLVNAPTYNAAGYFTFNGIDQYAERNGLIQSLDISFQTISIWFRPVSTPAANRPVWSDSFGPEIGVWIDQNNDVRSYVYGSSNATNVPNNNWVNVLFNFQTAAPNSGLSYKFIPYINGSPIQANITGTVGNGLNDLPLNIARDPGQPTLLSNIDVAIFQHWTVLLTTEEVQQNFQALRGRFGI